MTAIWTVPVLGTIAVNLDIPASDSDGYGTWHDDTIWCVPGTVLLGYNPSQVGTGGSYRNGCMLNPRGNVRQIALDGRAPYGFFTESMGLQLPYVMQPGDVVVIAKSAPETPWTPGPNGATGTRARPNYWANTVDGRSNVDELMIVTCVATPVREPCFRPPALGGGLSRILRGSLIPETALDYALNKRLLKFVDPAVVTGTAPDPTVTAGLVKRPWCDLQDGWTTDEMTPDQQQPGYGQNVGAALGIALNVASTIGVSSDLTKTILRGIVQQGIDYVGAFVDGRQLYANGGHCQGRKTPIIVAGWALDGQHWFGSFMKNIGSTLGLLGFSGIRFQEDDCAYDLGANKWFMSSPVWKKAWAFNKGNPPNPSPPNPWLDGRELQNSPAGWVQEGGTSPANNHLSWPWAMNGYLGNVCGSAVGIALWMKKHGLTSLWGTDLDGLVAQYMAGLSGANNTALTAANVNVPWSGSNLDGNYEARAYQHYYV